MELFSQTVSLYLQALKIILHFTLLCLMHQGLKFAFPLLQLRLLQFDCQFRFLLFQFGNLQHPLMNTLTGTITYQQQNNRNQRQYNQGDRENINPLVLFIDSRKLLHHPLFFVQTILCP